mgnify:CR=1 FL=1
MTWEEVLKMPGYGKKHMHPIVRRVLCKTKKPTDGATLLSLIRMEFEEENRQRAAGNVRAKSTKTHAKTGKPIPGQKNYSQINVPRAMPTISRLKVFINNEIRDGNMRQQGDNYVWVGGPCE